MTMKQSDGAGSRAAGSAPRVMKFPGEVDADTLVAPDSLVEPDSSIDATQRRAVAVLAEAGLVSPRLHVVPQRGEDAAA
jgi:hypothetical protein